MQVLKGAYDAFLTGKEVDLFLRRSEEELNRSRSAATDRGWRSSLAIVQSLLSCWTRNLVTSRHELEFKAYLESIGDSIVVVC